MQKLKSTIWRYYGFNFLQGFILSNAVLVPFYTQWGHLSLTQVQILQSWFLVWVFMLEVPTGALADYWGRKYALMLGGFMAAIATILYGSIPKFEVFLLAEIIWGVAVALFSGADDALLYDTLKEAGKEEESKKFFGRARSFNMLGMVTAAPLGSFIAFRFGLNVPVLLTAIPFLLAAIVALTIKEPVVHQQIQGSKRRYLETVRQGFSFFRSHKILRLLAFDAIIVTLAVYFVTWLYQPLLIRLNIPIFYFGFFSMLLVSVEMLVLNNFNFLEKLFGSARNYLRFSAIITGFAFLITAAFPNLIAVTLFIILAGGFGYTRMTLMSTYMNQFIPSEQRATVLSSISMFQAFALIILNPIIGFMADRSLQMAFLILGLLPLAVFLFSPIEQKMLESEPVVSN